MDSRDRLFGEIAVRLQLLTREQVMSCLKLQGGSDRRIGEIAVEQGFMEASEADMVLLQQQRIMEKRRTAREPAPAGGGVVEEAPTRDPRSASGAPGPRGGGGSGDGPAPARKRGARAWEAATEPLQQGQVEVPTGPEPAAAPTAGGTMIMGAAAAPPPASSGSLGAPPKASGHAATAVQPAASAPDPGAGDAPGRGRGGKPRRRVGDWQAAPEPQARIEVPSGPVPQPSPPHAGGPMPAPEPPAPAPAAPAPAPQAPAPAASAPSPTGDAVDGFPLAEGEDRAEVNLDDLPEALPSPAGPATARGTMLGTAAVQDAAPAAGVAAAPPPASVAASADAAPPGATPIHAAPPGAAGGTVFGVGGVPVPAGLPQRLPPAPVQPAPTEAAPIPTPPPPRAADVRPGGATEPGAQTYLGQALSMAVQHGASDLHAHSGAPLMIRVDGALHPLGNSALSSEAAEKVIAEVMTDGQWDVLRERGEVDFAYELQGLGRFRVNVYRQQRGLDVVFRIIPAQAPTLQQLGLPEALARLVDYRTGMVLCTGPAGCGKSTTLAALLSLLVQSRPDHILTVEDPIEHVFPPGAALVNQRQVRDHTSSFARALRAALREDPDIIAITELRDRETMSLAISAAETGHLVLGTLHTGNAAQTINRIVNAFPAEEQEQIRAMLAESLRAVVSQRLVPMATGRGRVPAIEMLMVNTAVANIIRDDKTHQLPSVMQTGRAAGMRTLDDSLAELVQAGTVDKEQARRFAVKKERFA